MWDNLELYAFNFNGLPYGEFTKAAVNLSIENIEGNHVASWNFYDGVEGVDHTSLRTWFDNRLMAQIVMKYDHAPAFVGFIYSMELSWHGLFLRKSIAPMANAVIATYTDVILISGAETRKTTYTNWFVDEESIAMYGYKEKVIDVNTESEEEANLRAKAHLAYYLDPYRSGGSFRETSKGSLRVEIKGPMVFGNHVRLLGERLRYHPDHIDEEVYYYGAVTTISDEITRILEIIEYQSGWLYPKHIAENLSPTRMGVPNTMGAFDRLVELAKVPTPDDPDLPIGETEYTYMELSVEADGGVIYREREQVPSYNRYPPPTNFETLDGAKPKWNSVPGFIKVMDPQHEPILPNSWIKKDNMVYAERVTMRTGAESAEFHEREEDLEDLYSDIQKNADWIEQWEKDDEEIV